MTWRPERSPRQKSGFEKMEMPLNDYLEKLNSEYSKVFGIPAPLLAEGPERYDQLVAFILKLVKRFTEDDIEVSKWKKGPISHYWVFTKYIHGQMPITLLTISEMEINAFSVDVRTPHIDAIHTNVHLCVRAQGPEACMHTAWMPKTL